MCRSEQPIDNDSISKISLFCNVKKESVIPALMLNQFMKFLHYILNMVWMKLS